MARCCGPILAGKPATTPLALMRSRFSAYATGDVDYIINTTDASGPQAMGDVQAWRAQIAAFSAGHRFVALEIVSAPEPAADQGFVHFRAHLQRDGATHILDEHSRFVRRDGVWLYYGAK